MKLTLEPTEEFFMAGDVMVRMWTGTDQDGKPVVALIAGVALSDGSARAPIAENLVSIPPPAPEDAERWAKTILERPTNAE